MGISLSSNHIYNIDKITKSQFKKRFTDMIKLKGYSTAKEDDAELCYSLVFLQDRKWVTILSENSSDARKNAADLAKSLGLQVLSV